MRLLSLWDARILCSRACIPAHSLTDPESRLQLCDHCLQRCPGNDRVALCAGKYCVTLRPVSGIEETASEIGVGGGKPHGKGRKEHRFGAHSLSFLAGTIWWGWVWSGRVRGGRGVRK